MILPWAIGAAAVDLPVGFTAGVESESGTVSPAASEAVAAAVDELSEILVQAPEPRYVAPTRRDQIGRIWAPVYINDHGPFRMVLDTGATHSAVTAMVAMALGIPMDQAPAMMMHGVTGSATVPSINVETLTVGDLAVDSPRLPIVPDAMGGAQGILGSEGLANKRIYIDFRHDEIDITFSRNQRSGHDFVDVPFYSMHGRLIVVNALIGDVRAKAIIDTGGQSTIANLALRDALARINYAGRGRPDEITGATLAVQKGEVISTPAIRLGGIRMDDPGVTYGDLYIFKQWKLAHEPAILIGMDALGVLDTLVIDYRRHELQIRTAKRS